MDVVVLNILNGLSLGFVLFLIATGLSITMGLMRILNLAHGALFLVAAYIGIFLVKRGMNFLLASILAATSAGLIGVGMERGFLRRLHEKLPEQVLLTFGVLYVLTNTVQWIWGSTPMIALAPLSGSIVVGEFSFPIYRLVVILIGLMTAVGLYLFQEKTRIGAMIRAGMDNKGMTMGLGINFELVCSGVFFFGAFAAGFAGLIGTPLMGVYPRVAVDVLLLALIVVVVGGMGSILGALFSALLIGLLDAFGKVYFPSLGYFLIYLALIVVLLIRPSGILGRKI
jgi:branched-chain amino acid transport system permease protein